ncbi:metalloregulator ArsR/SmtB family transcription factor [bacterium]|nr:metalloregulator ArsR/SmtB family transcription factor [bacterium]
MDRQATLFKTLSDPTRLRLAALLALRGETCVCELAQALDEPDFKISRHLAIMRAAGMVETRREGTWMHYQLAAPRSDFERRLHVLLREGLTDHPTLKEDLARAAQATCAPRVVCHA